MNGMHSRDFNKYVEMYGLSSEAIISMMKSSLDTNTMPLQIYINQANENPIEKSKICWQKNIAYLYKKKERSSEWSYNRKLGISKIFYKILQNCRKSLNIADSSKLHSSAHSKQNHCKITGLTNDLRVVAHVNLVSLL